MDRKDLDLPPGSFCTKLMTLSVNREVKFLGLSYTKILSVLHLFTKSGG